MRKKLTAVILCAALLFPTSVSAGVLDFEGTMNTYKQDVKDPPRFILGDGKGNTVTAIAKSDTLYVMTRDVQLRNLPGESGKVLRKVLLGTKLTRVAVCDNGWSKVTFQKKGEKIINGYVPNEVLSDTTEMKKFRDKVTMAQDSDILDFPGMKDGEVVGEVLEQDVVTRTGTVNDVWSRILYEDEKGKNQVGYIPTSTLKNQGKNKKKSKKAEETTDETVEAGIIHKSSGEGIFAEAVDGVTSTNGESTPGEGVQVGTPVSASSDASLVPLGMFRITHYCQCSICCGPYANGITSTGVTATTNRTIAVDPNQIPYGSKVVINGQVYVAEDCGGAIKENCIDIYVASHPEGQDKGVFYTDVYLLQE